MHKKRLPSGSLFQRSSERLFLFTLLATIHRLVEFACIRDAGKDLIGVLALFFGFAEAFAVRIQNVTNLPPNLIQLLPQFATLLALILVALREKLQLLLNRRRFRQQLQRGEMQSAASGD